ncbi:MAG: hypothetical protein DRI44_02505 [Chlamydiae bacterium]|nr:MAG: hypothetical protein DRI44_02505 [Chlamydiota bacterium]
MPAIQTYKITCPCCNTILVINKVTGEIVEERKPLVDKPSGDRFTDALRAQKEHSEKLDSLFDNSLSGIKEKEANRRDLFEKSLKKTLEEGIDNYKPIRDIDLD